MIERDGGQDNDHNSGDPSKVEIITPAATLGPNGFEQRSDGFIALGEEEDILAMYRASGWSEEALEALKRGEIVFVRLEHGLFGETTVPGSEDWLSKMKKEGRNTLGG